MISKKEIDKRINKHRAKIFNAVMVEITEDQEAELIEYFDSIRAEMHNVNLTELAKALQFDPKELQKVVSKWCDKWALPQSIARIGATAIPEGSTSIQAFKIFDDHEAYGLRVNMSEAAKQLGVSRNTMYNYNKKWSTNRCT